MVLAVLAAPVAAHGQSADPMTLLGVTIGHPLNLPACPGLVMNDRVRIVQTCTESGTQMISGRIVNHRIGLPSDQVPGFLRDRYFSAGVIDGRVETVLIFTNGISGQEAAYSQLVEKYGEPSDRRVQPVQNRLGARFEVIRATWNVGDLTVRFTGAGAVDQLDRGSIMASSAVGLQAQLDAMRDAKASAPKL